MVAVPDCVAFFEKTELSRFGRSHDDAKAGIALLLALGAAPRAENLVVARPSLTKKDAQAVKLGPDISKPRH